MKAENVTSKRDPEFFSLMNRCTESWLYYFDRAGDTARNCTVKNQRAEKKAFNTASKLQISLDTLTDTRGYDRCIINSAGK